MQLKARLGSRLDIPKMGALEARNFAARPTSIKQASIYLLSAFETSRIDYFGQSIFVTFYCNVTLDYFHVSIDCSRVSKGSSLDFNRPKYTTADQQLFLLQRRTLVNSCLGRCLEYSFRIQLSRIQDSLVFFMFIWYFWFVIFRN